MEMGYIAGLVDKNGHDASDAMLRMLRVASKGNASSYGIGNYRDTESYKDTPEFTSISSPIIIGAKNLHADDYPPAPLNQGSHSLIFKGILFDSDMPDILEVANLIQKDPLNGLTEIILTRDGAYSILITTKDSIICGLDHIGTIPLYYGENGTHRAIATNKRMLWEINIEPKALTPGNILTLSPSGLKTSHVKRLSYIKPGSMDESNSVNGLDSVLSEASEQISARLGKGVVAFSGGVDSTIVAHYLDQAGAELQLVTTGLAGQKEIEIAKQAAEYLGLPIEVETYTDSRVEELLEEVMYSVEEPDPMKIGIAYPFHWTSKKAYDMGYSTVFSGNGADELLGGYKRYHTEFIEGLDVSKMIIDDVLNSWSNNFHRDTKTCLDQGTRLILPFVHPKVVEYGLTIPVHHKLSANKSCLRKLVLRKLAKKIGIHHDIADRPKKAAQYSTGVDKALRRIAKKKGLSSRELVMIYYLNISKG